MATLLEYVGNVHIFLGPYRGNPVSIYLQRTEAGCLISPRVYPWNDVVGKGETPNKAAADFEDKWKAKGIASEMYDGPNWEGGIKPERPAPKPAPKPAAPPAAPGAAAAGTPGAPAAPAAPKPAAESAGQTAPTPPASAPVAASASAPTAASTPPPAAAVAPATSAAGESAIT